MVEMARVKVTVNLDYEVAAAALEAAATDALGMQDPPAPDCVEWAAWLRRRAARIRDAKQAG